MADDENGKTEEIAPAGQEAISEIKAAYLQGLQDAEKQETIGSEGLRWAAVVLSSAGIRLGKDPDLGVCLIAGTDFINDRFVVESFKRFVRDLEKLDPQAADDLRSGRPMEWSGDGDDDEVVPTFQAGGGNPYDEDEGAGAAVILDDDDMGPPIG